MIHFWIIFLCSDPAFQELNICDLAEVPNSQIRNNWELHCTGHRQQETSIVMLNQWVAAFWQVDMENLR